MNKYTTNDLAGLQQVVDKCESSAKVLAVTSGKGGVGKTNIAANLAVCMAASGKKALLVDADFSLGNLDVLLGINSKYNISHMIYGRKTLAEIIHIGPVGVEVICGASGLEDLANINEFERHRLLKELSRLGDWSDVIVIDTAAGLCRSTMSFCLAADHTLVVTTPEPTAMTDAYALIKVLVGHKYHGRVSLLVNMALNQSEGKKTYRQISTVASQFLGAHIYDAGVILRDDRLTAAVRQRQPVVLAYPKARITSSLVALSAKLASSSSAAGANTEGFFRRVADWFF